MDTNDNLVAIKMLQDLSHMLASIEVDDAAQIDLALTNLKRHISEFDAVFHKNLVDGLYAKTAADSVKVVEFFQPLSNVEKISMDEFIKNFRRNMGFGQ